MADLSSRYLNMIRGQQQRGGFQFTARSVLPIIAVITMCGSAVHWWEVQSQLTDNVIMAVAFTAIMVLAPPVLVSFLIPWSPGGMLLQKIHARTWGYVVVIIAALYLLYYSFEIQYSWWASQPVVADTGLIWQQVLIGIIGFIIIPALLCTPVNSEDLVEHVKQAHLVKRYEMQTQADIAILRNTLLRAQEKALVGFANLTAEERSELAMTMQGLVKGIDKTLKEVGHSVKTVSGATIPFKSLDDNEEIRGYLDYIHETLTYNSLPADQAQSRRHIAQYDDDDPADVPRRQRPARRTDDAYQYDEPVAGYDDYDEEPPMRSRSPRQLRG